MTNPQPTWGTTKTHGKPAQAVFFGQNLKAPWAEGVLVNITIDRSGFTATDAVTGAHVSAGGVATRYWAAPVTTTPEEVVTITVPKGANRPAAAKRTAKAAQRTPLPPKGATSAPSKADTAAVIKDELAKKPTTKRAPRARKVTFSSENAMSNLAAGNTYEKPQAKAPQTRQTARAELLASRKAGTVKLNKPQPPKGKTPHEKAADLVAEATAAGWHADSYAPGDEPADLVTFRAVRGDNMEEVVTLHWITGGTRPGTHVNGSRTIQAMNAATVRRILTTPAEAAIQVRAAYASGKGKAKRAAVKVATAPPLPFSLGTSLDSEILASVKGKTITWTNSISGQPETAVVAGTGKNAPKITGNENSRALVFPAKGEGFRTVRLSSITSVN